MPRWNLDDIDWSKFAPEKLAATTLALAKAASLTESNAARYTTYLNNVFPNDPEFQKTLDEWRVEEEQHGRALARYSELADPSFDFATTFKKFTEGYVIPVDVEKSIRGSKVGEMVARCVVETGTSSFYTALAESTEEPVLREICKHLAADEFRHYKIFFDGLKRYLPVERVSKARRAWVALGRLRESDDDELAYAYHCANEQGQDYDHKRANDAYARCAFGIYRFHHIQLATGMVLKAAGIKPQGWIGRGATQILWRMMSRRTEALAA